MAAAISIIQSKFSLNKINDPNCFLVFVDLRLSMKKREDWSVCPWLDNRRATCFRQNVQLYFEDLHWINFFIFSIPTIWIATLICLLENLSQTKRNQLIDKAMNREKQPALHLFFQRRSTENLSNSAKIGFIVCSILFPLPKSNRHFRSFPVRISTRNNVQCLFFLLVQTNNIQ